MKIILNIIVLIFEVLYYSMFMKFARKEGKFSRYLLLFVLFSIVSIFLDKKFMINYVIIILMILYGLKYIVKLKISLYDMLIIIIMMFVKTMIEIPLFYILTIIFSGVISTILFQLFKLLFVYVIRNKINLAYNYLKLKWNNNNFYIRYIFSVLMFAYVIVSCLFLILR